VNPYQCSKRAADTLNLIEEKRLQFRFAGDGTVTPFNRRWRTVGGGVGWHEALLRYSNLFLDAGLIDYVRPANRDVDEFDAQLLDWVDVFLTRAGKYLFDTWLRQPFTVLPHSQEAYEAGARALSAAYVANAGLQEDHPHRYAAALRSHLDAALYAMQAMGVTR
jgi:hypothetical protein